MITLTSGNLFEAETDALVNTVNTVGVMGKGIALQFKRAFPANYEAYRRACDQGELEPGKMFVFETGRLTPPRLIVNFPTKRHWRNRSRMEDIESGLEDLRRVIERHAIQSIAIPPLGCGNGGLAWDEVRQRIFDALGDCKAVEIQLYEPKGAPDPRAMPNRQKRPKMTPARALLLELMDRYGELGYTRSHLEVQKLAYLLQVAGEPLGLRYARGHYGPYAHALSKALREFEGHFTVGLGDREKPMAQIELLDGAIDEARRTLTDQPAAQERFDRVANLIEGFESPYGLELLASIHWLAEEERKVSDPDEALDALRVWTRRKADIFQPHHVKTAWQRLESQGWLAAA